MAFSVRLTDEERQIFESYAKLHGISIGEAMKKALFEKIEDEYDISIYNKALKEYEELPKTYTLSDIKKTIGK